MSKEKFKKEYDEIDHIREDIKSLKSNVVALTQHIKENGSEQVAVLETRARKTARSLSKSGKQKYEQMENHVRENPTQSVMMAFCGGLLASYLMKRRGQ